MTDTTVDSVLDDVLEHLKSTTWQTAREVHERIGRWSHISVRHALRALADENKIESRYDGTIMRPVREYRAWEEYDAQKDMAGSIAVGLEAIRERVAAGGEGWKPK